MKTRIKILSFLLFFAVFIGQSQTTWTSLTEKIENPNQYEDIDSNPLRGFCPSFNYNQDFPSGVEKFYIPLSDVYTQIGDLDWSAFDAKLDNLLTRGHHAIPRFWLSYPKSNDGRTDIPSLGMPYHLDALVPTWEGQVSAFSGSEVTNPKYNDEDLIVALEQFIAAYGAKYNNDERIAFVDVGLYGFWGEWHVVNSPNEEMNEVNKGRLIQAFLNAFPDKKVILRSSKKIDDTNLKSKIGYFDDSFGHRTINRTGRFWNDIVDDNLTDFWKDFPMGGEVFPDIPLADLYGTFPYTRINDVNAPSEHQDFDDCITVTHASWMVDHSLFANSLTAIQKENALKYHRLFGYRFFMNEVKIRPLADKSVFVEMKINNKGIAPFYYNWDVEFAYVNSNDSNDFGVITNTDAFNITEILPEAGVNAPYEREILTASIPNNGDYKILMRIVNPLETLTVNAKKLRFANTTQDADLDGWLTLGNVTINPSNVVSVTGVTLNPSNTSVNVGETTQLSEDVSPSNASVKNVTYSSSDESIATVSNSGEVFGISKGIATITITTLDGNFQDTTVVNVTPINITSVSIAPVNSNNTININNIIQLTETVLPFDATDKAVNWSSNNASVVSVDANGVITALSSGNATITITTVDGGLTDTLNITVTSFVAYNESAMVNFQRWDNIVGDNMSDLKNNVDFPNNPINAGMLDLSVSNFRSNNIGGPANDYGVRILAKLVAPETGTYYFYLTADDRGELSLSTDDTQENKQIIAFTNVYVPEQNWYYTNNGNPLAPNQKSMAVELTARNSYYIEAIMKENQFGDHIAVGWRKPSDGDGLEATELIPGSVLKPYDPNFTPVNVTGVSITNCPSIDLNVGDTFQLIASVLPSNATNKGISSWSSSNTSIVNVNASGMVTAIGNGSATITVETTEGNFTTDCSITSIGPTGCNLPWQDPLNHSIENTGISTPYIYSSGLIDISCASGVNISADIEGLGGLDEGQDFLNIYYKLDNGAQELLANRVTKFNLETITSSILSGKTLEVIIEGANSAGGEIYNVTNLSVNESSELSVDTINNDNIILFPNPVNKTLHITINEGKPYRFSLINVLGKVVLNKPNLNGKKSFSVKGFNAGIYFVRITTETAQTVKKIIIK